MGRSAPALSEVLCAARQWHPQLRPLCHASPHFRCSCCVPGGPLAGGPLFARADGRFISCLADASTASGIVITVGIALDYRWYIAFKRASWTFPPETRFPIRVRFDGGEWWKGEARSIGRDNFYISMGPREEVMTLFRRGLVMEIDDGRGIRHEFPLERTDRMIGRLLDCVRTEVAAERERGGPDRRNAAGGGSGGGSATSGASASAGGSASSGGERARSAEAGATAANAPPSGVTREREKEKPSDGASGTGLFVSQSGHAVTNHHVIDECKAITLQRPGEAPVKAALVTSDPANDLALLKADVKLEEAEVGAIAGGRPPPAGAPVAVYGFPLAGALASTGNIVAGNISALAGLGNDINFFQISAPVQPGNSGGPLLDYRGAVVGVVQSKISDRAVIAATGTVPQTVNFAIKAIVLQNFLEVHSSTTAATRRRRRSTCRRWPQRRRNSP